MISHPVQTSVHIPTKDRVTVLRSSAHAFCQSLLSPPPVAQLLAEFFIPDSANSKPIIQEHGPSWASSRLPFLGRPFTGVGQCGDYFEVLADTLKMHLSKDSFPGEDGFVVDAEKSQVCVVGKGKFESVRTGRSWDEKFSYVLSGWDDEGKLGRWDIWADPLSAWVAVGKEDLDGWKAGEHRS